jgi:hypothetical protein
MRRNTVNWYTYVAHFFAGLFLTNGIPHFVNGMSGRRFPSPFGKPPGVGLSSPYTNILWGLFNFLVGYFIIKVFGSVDTGISLDMLIFVLGGVAIAFVCARQFGSVQKNNAAKPE